MSSTRFGIDILKYDGISKKLTNQNIVIYINISMMIIDVINNIYF